VAALPSHIANIGHLVELCRHATPGVGFVIGHPASLQAEGLSGAGRYAFLLDRGDQAGEYVAKFGAAEEVTFGQQKTGRCEGRTPF